MFHPPTQKTAGLPVDECEVRYPRSPIGTPVLVRRHRLWPTVSAVGPCYGGWKGGYASAGSAQECGGGTRLRVGLHNTLFRQRSTRNELERAEIERMSYWGERDFFISANAFSILFWSSASFLMSSLAFSKWNKAFSLLLSLEK
jgi:hypothetical protein